MEPVTFKSQVAQGDLFIRRVDAVPDGFVESKDHVVAHSETGHHHILEGEGVSVYRHPSDDMVCYLSIASDATLVHHRPWDTHAPIAFAKGCYEARRQREHTPEGWRMVED